MVCRVVMGVGVGGGHAFIGGGKIMAIPYEPHSLERLKTLLVERFLQELDVIGTEPVII
jgi:hypothetical protein